MANETSSPSQNPLNNTRAEYTGITPQQQPASCIGPSAPATAASSQNKQPPPWAKYISSFRIDQNTPALQPSASYSLQGKRDDVDGGLLASDIYYTGPLDGTVADAPASHCVTLRQQGYRPEYQGRPIRLIDSVAGIARWASANVPVSPAPRIHPAVLTKALAASYAMDHQMPFAHAQSAQIPQNQDARRAMVGLPPAPYRNPLYIASESVLQPSSSRDVTTTAQVSYRSEALNTLAKARHAIQTLYDNGRVFAPETPTKDAYVLAIRGMLYTCIGRNSWATLSEPRRASVLVSLTNAANDKDCHGQIQNTLKKLVVILKGVEYIDPELADDEKNDIEIYDNGLFQQQFLEHSGALLRSICEGTTFAGNENPQRLANTRSFLESKDPKACFFRKVDVACMALILWPDQDFTSYSAALAKVLKRHKQYLRNLASHYSDNVREMESMNRE